MRSYFNPFTSRCQYCSRRATHVWRYASRILRRHRAAVTCYLACCDEHVAAAQIILADRPDATKVR